MKRITKFLVAAAAAVCVLPLAACGTPNYRITTSPNWDERVSMRNDLTESSAWLTHKEAAEYTITFAEGTNPSYSLGYVTDGSKPAAYATEFYAVEYDWNRADVDSSYNLPASYREDRTELVYAYRTELTLSGKFTVGEESHAFDNHIITLSYFRSADNNLQPVYSRQTVKCTSPAGLSAGSLEGAYVELDCDYETFYNPACSEAYVASTDRKAENAETQFDRISLSGEYTLFDTAYLGAALRSLTFSGTQVFNLNVPLNGGTSLYQVAFSASAALDTETHSSVAAALDSAVESGYLFLGTDGDGVKQYDYNAATVSLSASMPGPSYSYWYAHVADADMNASRAVLLKMIQPVTFGLGTITYSLSRLTYAEI